VTAFRRLLPAAVLGLVSLAAFAQDFPTRPVKILVPYPPGGATDVTARLLAEQLTKKWGQAVFVENKAGVNGVIGTEVVANAEPDGYTIGFVASSHVVNPALYKQLPYKLTDLAPVMVTTQVQMGLVVNKDFPAKTVAELIALAKANPGKYNVATSGRGSNPEIWALAFDNMAGIKLQDVPYKGSGAAHPDLLGGRINVMFDAMPSVLPHIKSGAIRLLAVGGTKRSPYLPDTPTITESGLPGYSMASWAALIVPAKTPTAIVDKINRDVAAVLRDPAQKERLAGMMAEVLATSPSEAAAFMNSEEKRLTKLLKDVGVEPE
jgi:tripartite-type tricarboxylate transporter receptor subunit TctC